MSLQIRLLGAPAILGDDGKAFCLAEAPDAATVARVHREADGLVAEQIFEVREGT
jgi:hypothetical protein